MRGTAHAGDSLGPEGGIEERRGRGSVRGDEALRQGDDAGTVRDAEPAELLDRVADALGGHCEQDQVGALQVLLLSTEVRDPEIAWQLDALQVAPVLTGLRQLLGLLARAAQERRAYPRPLEQDRNRRAERPGSDDSGTTRMLARIADGRGR
jgi:hypothetical protein